MSIKKEKQWKIDRAFKISDENEERLKNILTCIRPVKNGDRTKDEAIEEAKRLGVLAVRDGDNARGREGYEQSTATLPRSYGLINKDAYETAEVSDYYLDGIISFKDLITLQLLKKEFIYNDDMTGEVLHPLAVTLKVLLKISNIDYIHAWIDAYDYFHFLTEIKNSSDIENCANKIIESHKGIDRINDYKINDFDMWAGSFLTTRLFTSTELEKGDLKTIRYSLNIEEIDFIKWLVSIDLENIGTSKRVRTEDVQRRFGMIESSIVSQIPRIEIDSSLEFQLKGIKCEKEILELYLFEGLSYSEIEKRVFGEKIDGQGWMVKAILGSYGFVNADIKGIFTPFKTRRDLVKLSMNDKKNTRVYKGLFEDVYDNKDDMDDETIVLKPLEGRVQGGYNKIYYGIPGCGKSYKVSNEVLAGVPQENIFRTTFYLDYTNADFVGQLVPKTKNKNVTYEPNLGPFSKALKRACETTEMVYLVIEEINRGNSAAIFGDLFQLLDRLDMQKAVKRNDGSIAGDSEYPITNNFIEDYLHFEKGKVIIPSNLTILATMNTSDQNVFPLDTAFKRRWDRESVVTDWTKVDIAHKCIPYTDFTWEHFATSINNLIVSEDANGTISEDKKMGPYFIDSSILVEVETRHSDSEENKTRLRKFASNIVDYLYNDVTKFDHEVLFSETSSYDTVYNGIIEISTAGNVAERTRRFVELFANKIKADIKSNGPTGGAVDDGNETTDNL